MSDSENDDQYNDSDYVSDENSEDDCKKIPAPKYKTYVCEFCNKNTTDDTKMKNTELIQCVHCYFQLNYNTIDAITGKHGMDVSEYIARFSDTHVVPCPFLGDGGGCYLCMSILGFPIDGLDDIVKKQKTPEMKPDANPLSKISDDMDCLVKDISCQNGEVLYI